MESRDTLCGNKSLEARLSCCEVDQFSGSREPSILRTAVSARAISDDSHLTTIYFQRVKGISPAPLPVCLQAGKTQRRRPSFRGSLSPHLLAIALKAPNPHASSTRQRAQNRVDSGAFAHDVPQSWLVSTISIPHASSYQDLLQVGSCSAISSTRSG